MQEWKDQRAYMNASQELKQLYDELILRAWIQELQNTLKQQPGQLPQMTPIALGDSMISTPMVGNEETTPMAWGNSIRVTNNNNDADTSVEVENRSKALQFYVDTTIPSRQVVTNPKSQTAMNLRTVCVIQTIPWLFPLQYRILRRLV